MRGKSGHPEFLFPDLEPDPPKKKAPARTVNADAGTGGQECNGTLPPQSPRLKTKAHKQTRANRKQEIEVAMDESDFAGEKSTFSGEACKKAPPLGDEKAPSGADGKAPSYYLPVVLSGVVDGADLKSLLVRHKQQEWTSKKRIAGLMLIIDFIARKGPGTTKMPGTAMSSVLSREYISDLKRFKNASTIRQPLQLLVDIGILEIAQKAIVAPHRKTSARYRLHPKHGKPKKIEVMLTTQQRDKRQNAEARNAKRLNRKHAFRRQLLVDLAALGLSPDGVKLSLKLIVEGRKEAGIKRLMEFLDGGRPPEIQIDPCGTIHTFARMTPKELKAHLTIHGKPVANCDIQSAHICVLSCLIQERIVWKAKRGMRTADLEQERRKLIDILETTDIYEHLAEGGNRDALKKSLLSSWNMQTSTAVHLHGYQRFRGEFPLAVRIIEDIKKKGHHGISRPLQHHTANIVRIALLELQQIGIPAIPDTDALIVPSCHEITVMQIINRALFQVTGIQRNR